MKHKPLNFTRLELPNILQSAAKFRQFGHLATTANRLTYLNIDDAYIHKLFPLLQKHYADIEKPDYFGQHLIGAHVSVIYPEENVPIAKEEIGTEYDFKVRELVLAHLDGQHYYALAIHAPALLDLRRRYGLVNKLCFKEYLVDLHITLAVGFG